jgi:hypothetical protein
MGAKVGKKTIGKGKRRRHILKKSFGSGREGESRKEGKGGKYESPQGKKGKKGTKRGNGENSKAMSKW